MVSPGFFSADSLAGVHVMLVGREPLARAVLASALQYGGALVTPVDTAADAFALMRHVRADVLVAVVSGADDGDLGQIRDVRTRKPEHGGVMPMVLLTPPANAPSPDGVRAAGFDACLTLPVSLWRLCRLVADLVATEGR